mmetsp:Transcript_26151/g.71035  ORF Transcript_26151/g.71035 Transcript_26151/m.71035 type:complete len:394 (+) Transcript_26151:15-1196(+)
MQATWSRGGRCHSVQVYIEPSIDNVVHRGPRSTNVDGNVLPRRPRLPADQGRAGGVVHAVAPPAVDKADRCQHRIDAWRRRRTWCRCRRWGQNTRSGSNPRRRRWAVGVGPGHGRRRERRRRRGEIARRGDRRVLCGCRRRCGRLLAGGRLQGAAAIKHVTSDRRATVALGQVGCHALAVLRALAPRLRMQDRRIRRHRGRAATAQHRPVGRRAARALGDAQGSASLELGAGGAVRGCARGGRDLRAVAATQHGAIRGGAARPRRHAEVVAPLVRLASPGVVAPGGLEHREVCIHMPVHGRRPWFPSELPQGEAAGVGLSASLACVLRPLEGQLLMWERLGFIGRRGRRCGCVQRGGEHGRHESSHGAGDCKAARGCRRLRVSAQADSIAFGT